MKKNYLVKVFITAAIITFLPVISFAQTGVTGGGGPTGVTGGGGPTGVTSGGTFQLVNPLNVSSFCGLLNKLLQAAIELGIPIAILFLVYAGFLFVKARGNSSELEHAKKNLFYVIIGIGIFLGAWGLGQIIAATLNNLQAGTGNQPIPTACV